MIDDQSTPEPAQPEPDYEPPKVEELATEERTATASWLITA